MNKIYTVLQPLLFGTSAIAIGEKVELTDKQAAQLLEIGHIELGEQKPVELTDAEKHEAVKSAVKALDINVAGNFTKSGVPNSGVLATVVGFEVSAALRDAVWAEVQSEVAAKTSTATTDLAGNAGSTTA